MENAKRYLRQTAKKEEWSASQLTSRLSKLEQSKWIWIGSFPPSASNDEVKQFVSKGGPFEDIKLGIDEELETFNGRVFAKFTTHQKAVEAAVDIDKQKFKGKIISAELVWDFEEDKLNRKKIKIIITNNLYKGNTRTPN